MIVQCAAKRSGNYLLWRILHGLLQRSTSYESFYASEGRLESPIGFTHRRPEQVPNGIYLVRDGRDAVHSLFRFVVTPEYRARYPDCQREDARELLEVPGFFERRIRDWREHVRSYLDDSRPWHLVRYEELAGATKGKVISGLAEFLELELEPQRLVEILSDTTVKACREAAPGHVHCGTPGRSRSLFSARHLEQFEREAGEELRALGYELSASALTG